MCTGWSKGGKTETLLAFAAHGATYVGDEWLYVEPDGSRVHGIPEPIRVWDWHLAQLDDVRASLSARDRRRLAALRVARRAGDAARGRAARVADRVLPLLETQLHVDVPPATLFGGQLGSMTAPFDRLFLVLSAEVDETTTEPVDPAEVAARMAASLAYERLPFLGWYHTFRYAFPDAVNTVVEDADDRERKLLGDVFAGKPAHAVVHPYPVEIASLHDAISPLLHP